MVNPVAIKGDPKRADRVRIDIEPLTEAFLRLHGRPRPMLAAESRDAGVEVGVRGDELVVTNRSFEPQSVDLVWPPNRTA